MYYCVSMHALACVHMHARARDDNVGPLVAVVEVVVVVVVVVSPLVAWSVGCLVRWLVVVAWAVHAVPALNCTR